MNTNPSFDLFPVRVALSTFKYLLNEALMERVMVVRSGGGGGRGMGGEGGLKLAHHCPQVCKSDDYFEQPT